MRKYVTIYYRSETEAYTYGDVIESRTLRSSISSRRQFYNSFKVISKKSLKSIYMSLRWSHITNDLIHNTNYPTRLKIPCYRNNKLPLYDMARRYKPRDVFKTLREEE